MRRKPFHTFRLPMPGRALSEGFCRFFDSSARLLSKLLSVQRITPPALFFCAGLMLLTAILLFSSSPQYTPGPYGIYARLPVSHAVLTSEELKMEEDVCFPDLANAEAEPWASEDGSSTSPALGGGPLVRGAARLETGNLPYCTFSAFTRSRKQQGLVLFSRGRVSIPTVDGAVPIAPLRHASIPLMVEGPDIFQVNMFAPRSVGNARPPLLYGEATNQQGVPLRWEEAETAGIEGLICGTQRLRNADIIRHLLHGLGLFSSDARFSAQAGKYRPFVHRYAEKYGLASSLVLAIMQTESDFNPYAISQSQAVGLMQIVPGTAGNEVHRYLTGSHGIPSLETLFSPEHNIRYGTTYLHLLARRYFGGVRNAASRQMCMIAAYNGGPNAVLRLFHSDTYLAVARINELSPAQVYTALTTEMPNQETRRYVELVLGRMRSYAGGNSSAHY